MKPSSDLGYMLQHVAFILARQSDQVLLEQLGIGFSQFKILLVLQWNTDVQQRQIAESLGQTEASISRQIKLLQSQGLLTSEVSTRSKREHVIRPTSKGVRVTEQAQQALGNYHGPMFAKLSEREQQQLANLLGILHDAACESSWPRSCAHPWDRL